MLINKMYPPILQNNYSGLQSKHAPSNVVGLVNPTYFSASSQSLIASRYNDISSLAFKGLINHTSVDSTYEIGEKILNTYKKKLQHCNKISGVKLLGNQKKLGIAFMLFKKPMKFNEVFNFFNKNKDEIIKYTDKFENKDYGSINKAFNTNLNDFCIDAIEKKLIPNFYIKGVMGYGEFSSVFLNSENKIIKLSKWPSFTDEKHFIKGVDVPLYDRYIATIGDKTIYGSLQAFTEVGNVKLNSTNPLDMAKFCDIWKNFNDTIKKCNSEYKFGSDFEKSPISLRQIGFIGETPYLIDSDCVEFRPLCTKL